MTPSPPPPSNAELPSDLQRQYALRFGAQRAYRDAVWKILTSTFFQKWIAPDATLLDLGCGWGEFVNNIVAAKKYGMDLNPDARAHLHREVELIEQDCAQTWPLKNESLDCVFTSNFFEHLQGKDDLRRTLSEVCRCLRPGGRLICMGPNIRYLPGAYWDFWDHHLPLSERSLSEALELMGLRIERCVPRFLPYQMSGRTSAPMSLVRLYLKLPPVWPLFGKQFLVVAAK